MEKLKFWHKNVFAIHTFFTAYIFHVTSTDHHNSVIFIAPLHRWEDWGSRLWLQAPGKLIKPLLWFPCFPLLHSRATVCSLGDNQSSESWFCFLIVTWPKSFRLYSLWRHGYPLQTPPKISPYAPISEVCWAGSNQFCDKQWACMTNSMGHKSAASKLASLVGSRARYLSL